jgi:hypothetical protein
MVVEPLLARRRLTEVRDSLRRERLADELDHQSGSS